MFTSVPCRNSGMGVCTVFETFSKINVKVMQRRGNGNVALKDCMEAQVLLFFSPM